MTEPSDVPIPDDPGMIEDWNHVQAMHDRYDAAISYATKSQTHLWAVMSMHQLTDAEVHAMVEANEANELRRSAAPTGGKERVLSIAVGCYICEDPLDSRTLHRRCPGEPRHG